MHEAVLRAGESESGSSVTAGETAENAPVLELADEPYTITLVPGEAGYVKLAAPDTLTAWVVMRKAPPSRASNSVSRPAK